eukprot:1685712-Pyramimonas_sp.AAC.1
MGQAEERQQAVASEQAVRALAEPRELDNKVEASTAAEKRAQALEQNIAEEAARVVRGAGETQQRTMAGAAEELKAAEARSASGGGGAGG